MVFLKKILNFDKPKLKIKKGSFLLENVHLSSIDFFEKEEFFFPKKELKNKNLIFLNDIQYQNQTLITNKITNKNYLLRNKLLLKFLKDEYSHIIKGRVIKKKGNGFLIGILGKTFFCKTSNIFQKYKKKTTLSKLKIVKMKFLTIKNH